MKHFPTLVLSILVLLITLLCGVSLGMYLWKCLVCQALADAMEIKAWDLICEEPLDEREGS